MRASVRSLPDCSGRCRCSHTHAHSAIAAIVSGRRSFGCGDVNRMRSMPSTASTARSRSANCGPVLAGAEVAAVGVDVLAEQRDLDDAVGGELLDLVHDVAHPPADLPPAHRRHDAERARVVAADLDRDPRRVIDLAPGRQRRRIRLVLLEDLDDRPVDPRPARAAPARCARLCVPNTTSTCGAPLAAPGRGPSGRGSRRPRSAGRAARPSATSGDRGGRRACCRRSRGCSTC